MCGREREREGESVGRGGVNDGDPLSLKYASAPSRQVAFGSLKWVCRCLDLCAATGRSPSSCPRKRHSKNTKKKSERQRERERGREREREREPDHTRPD